MTLFSDRINTAISTARSGEREKALAIFREIVEEAPANVQAWLWISELSRNLEDQTRALEYAIKYSSESKETQKDLQAQLYELRGMMGLSAPAEQYNTLFPRQKLEYSKDTQLIDEACQQAQWLEFQGRHEEAIQALQELEKNNLANERVWLLMSDLEPNLAVKIRLLNRVLERDPDHREAARRLSALRPMIGNPLRVGQNLEENGEFEQAIDLYRAVTTHSKSAADRIEANRRILNIKLLQEANRAKVVHPNLSLLRLTAGPVLLFVIMVFIQSGLNLLHLPMLTLPGFLSILAGSLILSATDMRPVHPQWIAWFGVPGTGSEPQKRRDARILGWGLLLMPLALFLIGASVRLGILQSTMSAAP